MFTYHPETAPCGEGVWGTDSDIDSGLHKHIESCDECEEILDQSIEGESQ